MMTLRKPLCTAAAALFAAGAASSAVQAGSLKLEAVDEPTTDQDKHAIASSGSAMIKGSMESTGFNTLLRSGDELPLLVGTEPSATETERFGKLYWYDRRANDGTGGHVALTDEGEGGCKDFANRDESCADVISNSNDFNSLHPVGDKLFLVSHFETRPAAMYLTLLDQDPSGVLKPRATRLIDFSGVGGGWVHCAGTKTPWGSHLGSEEYEPDARQWVDEALTISPYNAAMYGYFNPEGWRFNNNDPQGTPATAQTGMNPYRYGYPVEVQVNADGSTDVTKHYAMGRSANELSIVMPDNKTVYITDDGTNTALLMFIAETADGAALAPGDLSQGTLYAARWSQIADTGEGGRAELGWVNLGHAQRTAIEAAVDGGLTFADLFSFADPEGDSCPSGFVSINAGHKAPFHECLKTQAGVDLAVLSRLELRRYAALRGATTEFRKMEGATLDPAARTLYLAMSDIGSGMTDGDATRDIGGPNHIRLSANKCGAVYGLGLGGDAKDSDGKPIRSNYVAGTMTGILAGERVADSGDNQCSQDGIGNPDNLTLLPGYNTLVIGEDADNSVHQIDYIWAYDLGTKALTRIQTTPFGAETTSPYWYPNLNGFGYLMSVVQHPYGESDMDKLDDVDESAKYGYVGYFPFPALD